MDADILRLREHGFVLWRLAVVAPPPRLVIGRLQPGAPVGFAEELRIDLQPSAQFSDLWQVAAADCGLLDGDVYHYWFEVTDAHPERSGQRILVTDPLATLVDWRLRAPQPP